MPGILATKLQQLAALEPIEPEKTVARDEDQMRQMSMACALGTLAHLDHDKEYATCRSACEHILGRPTDSDTLD